jgi:hypothetical protein
MPVLAPVQVRVNVKDQQSRRQQYDYGCRVSPMPQADRQRMPVVNRLFGKICWRFH